MEYVRLYTDANGETHFGTGEIDLVTTNFAPPAAPFYVSSPVGVAQVVFVSLPLDWFGDWHPAPRKQWWVQFTGQLEVEVSDGAIRRFGPGDLAILEDVNGKGHLTRVIGGSEVRGAFVQF